jgi:hypothetical protein
LRHLIVAKRSAGRLLNNAARIAAGPDGVCHRCPGPRRRSYEFWQGPAERLLPALRTSNWDRKSVPRTPTDHAFVRVNTHRTAALLHVLLKSSVPGHDREEVGGGSRSLDRKRPHRHRWPCRYLTPRKPIRGQTCTPKHSRVADATEFPRPEIVEQPLFLTLLPQ